jgi:hypothetical protein
MTFTTNFQEKVKNRDVKYELSQLFEVSYHTIEQRWLKPEKYPTITQLDNVKKLCDFYSLTINEIFDFKYE